VTIHIILRNCFNCYLGFNELLPLFIDSIPGASGWIALVLPTITVMIFGEIIPQSFCTRYGLAVGARLSMYSVLSRWCSRLNISNDIVWLVKGLQILFFPIAWPFAWVLNKVLGEELGNIYNHRELKTMIEMHSHKKYGELSDVETTILKGVLDFRYYMREYRSGVNSLCRLTCVIQ